MTGSGPPPSVSLASPWSRVDHNGFGSYMSDSGIFIPCISNLHALAFASPFGLPLEYTPWLLLQEEWQNTVPFLSLDAYASSLQGLS